jgi:predicted metal-dependent enzyme (double-stranded beta helix superfamily)
MLPMNAFTADPGSRPRLSGPRLAELVRAAAADDDWAGLVRFTRHERWYRRLAQEDNHEVWLLTWLPGQRTGFHDHCGSAGAFTVVRGGLQEYTMRPGSVVPAVRDLRTWGVRSFGPRHVHEVVNASAVPAVSIHAYSPPLAAMRRYELTRSGLVAAAVESAGERW